LNPGKKILLLFLLTAISAFSVPAQTNTTNTANTVPSIMERTTIPQWVKDLRRWEIVAFGSIPFTMFTATFAMDMYRWNNANGMNFSDRRYAPWPLKSAGAVSMKGKEQEMVFILAAGLSVGIAMTDQVIVQIKRYRARKRAESLPAGSTIITRKPWPEETSGEQDGAEVDEAVPVTPELP
jgi:hypothetical protein